MTSARLRSLHSPCAVSDRERLAGSRSIHGIASAETESEAIMARRTRWALLLALMLVGSATMAGSANAGSSVDTSGIEVVGPDALQFRATDEAQAMAFDGALNLAYANRADMGYPWIDFAAKTLDLTVFDDAGQKAALLAEGGLDA